MQLTLWTFHGSTYIVELGSLLAPNHIIRLQTRCDTQKACMNNTLDNAPTI